MSSKPVGFSLNPGTRVTTGKCAGFRAPGRAGGAAADACEKAAGFSGGFASTNDMPIDETG
jgi:hypothetical protein